MPELVTMGETMAVFTPAANGPLRYVPDYRLRVAGAESNTATGVQKLGHSAGWISSLGEDEMGHFILNTVRSEGVDASRVRMDEQNRTGLMMKETSYGNETRVFYYRDNSAFSHYDPNDLDEEYIKSARILHLTGITPLLGESCRAAVFAAVEIAEAGGIPVSFDPNVRMKLWGKNDYTPMMLDLMKRAEIVLLGRDEAARLLGTADTDGIFGRLFENGATRYVALKDGGEGAWAASPDERHHIPPHPCRCIDPVGAGDAFNAAFLVGVLEGCAVGECGKMGGIAGALATQTFGDVEGQPSRADLRRALNKTQEIFR